MEACELVEEFCFGRRALGSLSISTFTTSTVDDALCLVAGRKKKRLPQSKDPFPPSGPIVKLLIREIFFLIWTWLDNRNRVRECLILIYAHDCLFIFILVLNAIVSYFHSSDPEKTITQWQATTPVNEDMVAPTVAPMAVHHRRPTRHPCVATICR